MVVRPVVTGELDWFAGLAGAPDAGLAASLSRGLAAGMTSLDRILVATGEDGRTAGRAALVVDDPDAPMEAWLTGFWLAPWLDAEAEAGAGPVAQALVEGLVAASAGLGVAIDARINAETTADPVAQVAVLASAGFTLFQEKAGLVWTDDGAPVPEPGRLRFTSLDDLGPDGRDMLAGVMARGTAGTLDRNDTFFRDLVGPAAWGRIMTGFATPEDDASWFLARLPDGRDAGYVLLSAFGEPGVATIVHIGVVPEQRGSGYVLDLLSRANLAARARGFTSILSDVDVDNAPMLAAMARAGHRSGVRPWHVWHLRHPAP
ncbi:MAG: hypothetical protein U0869_21190 [Chloroflexota bacterium]